MEHRHALSALTQISHNKKTGPIAVSSTGWSSCPPTCGAREICYAMKGYHTRIHADKITREERGVPPEQFIKQVAALPPATLFRHDVAGDLWHNRGRIDRTLLKLLTQATSHLRAAWTYTHHKPDSWNQYAIRKASAEGFTVNLSTEDLDQAVALKRRGYPVTCIVKDMPETFRHKGVTFIRCPHQVDGGKTQCISCGDGHPLCSRAGRSFIIAFEEH